MNIKLSLITIFVMLLLLAGSAVAQKPVKFTSVYTRLTTGCKTLKGTNGTDDAALCKGAGNYQVRLYYSATMAHLNAELKGTDESVTLLMTPMSFDEKKATLEWRLADGKPFAVILRKPVYPETADVTSDVKPTGEELEVIGLIGYGDIVKGSVDAKTANANVKARALADAAYNSAQPK